MDALEDLFTLLENSIQEEPPLALKEGIIRMVSHEDVDHYRQEKRRERRGFASWKLRT